MKLRLTITAALIALAPAVSATTIYNTGTLIFETQERQSIWGEGNAIRYEGEAVSYTHLTLPTTPYV